jgi:DNA-binding CsgD family transcriptional regulator
MGNHDVPLNDITGPLTDRQHDVLKRVAIGEEHASIAADHKVGRAAISQDMRRVVIKMGALNTNHALALHAQGETLRRVAEETLGLLVREPSGETEEHLNNVLRDLSASFTAQADALLPVNVQAAADSAAA